MAFRFDKLTIKAQEAVQRAQELAADAGIRRSSRCTCWPRCSTKSEGVVRPVLEKIGANVEQLEQIVDAELKHLPKSSGGAPPQRRAAALEGARRGPGRSRRT